MSFLFAALSSRSITLPRSDRLATELLARRLEGPADRARVPAAKFKPAPNLAALRLVEAGAIAPTGAGAGANDDAGGDSRRGVVSPDCRAAEAALDARDPALLGVLDARGGVEAWENIWDERKENRARRTGQVAMTALIITRVKMTGELKKCRAS